MVRTEPVGKKRPFLRGLVLTALTFGIYGLYWKYQALHELYEQFELHKEGRDDGVAWLVVGVVLPVVMLVYYWKAVGNVRYLRRRLDLPEGIDPETFVGIHVASRLLLLVVVLGGVGAAGAELAPRPVLVAAGAVGVLASYGLLAYGYRRLQGDVNEVWDAWRERHEELTGPDPGPEAGPPTDPTPEGDAEGVWGRTGSRG